MAYQSLYRKYRPQTFADVMGQGHVVRTLQNALASGRIAHGYLFTGTRGTAKTTVARLLAKALNCESAAHPVAEPCNHCDACKSITAGTCIDVIEMDAASHRGVADIEEVRKAVGYGPMQFRYKVFIIDEAHQLSSDAKDAFLKTLEEPPANVVFVLATTEPQAIPITIRSRCQQFDFKRGSLAEITTRLRYVLDCEGVTYEPAAMALVARGAEGSYRDSLSLLEQVLAFAPTRITATDVETVLGSLDAEMLSRVVHAVAERNAPEAFSLAGKILDAGKEARTLLRTMSLHFRDLLLVSVGGPAVSVEMTPDEVQQLQGEARLFSPQQMMRAMDILNEAQGETRWNNQHRLLTELTFLKLMNLGDGQGENRAFVTAPIVFSAVPSVAAPAPAPVTTNGIANGSLNGTHTAPAPQLVTPLPIPVVVSTPPPAVVQETPALVEQPPVIETVPEIPVAVVPVAPVVETTSEPREELPSAFFAEDTTSEDEDGIEYEPETTDDEDAPPPLTDEDAPPPNGSVMAASLPVEVIVAEAEASANGESGEWQLFADEPQTGPGLFDDPEPAIVAPVPVAPAIVVPVATVSPPPNPPPTPVAMPVSISEVGQAESEPLFPTTREGIQQPPALSLPSAAEEPNPEANLLPEEATATDQPEDSTSSAIDTIEEINPEDEEPIVTLGQVQQAWPGFLQQVGRISRKTEILLRGGEPSGVAGRVVIIMMHHRTSHEMLTEKPEAQAFIRKLLCRVMGKEGISVRLELDPTQAAPLHTKKSESREPKKKFDRLAAIDELVLNGAAVPHLPPSTYGSNYGGSSSLGWSGGNGARETISPPVSPPTSTFGNFGTAPAFRDRVDSVGTNTPQNGPANVSSTEEPTQMAPSAQQKRMIGLAEPLVQEVLSIFGGDIIIE